MFQVAEAGGGGVNFHTGDAKAYTPIGPGVDGQHIARPLYYGMLAVIVIAIFGRDDDRLNEGLLIGIYVGAFGSISVLFVLRYLGLF